MKLGAFVRRNDALALLIFVLLACLFFQHIKRQAADSGEDLFGTETLPESELDALLSARGIDEAVIKCIPIWEKQYLIDSDVDAAIFGESVNTDWENNDEYEKLPDDKFFMQIIVARIWREEGEKRYPVYHIIIPYEWKKLPVWTGEDDLVISWDEEKYLIEGSMETCRRVSYVRRGGKIAKAIAERSAYSAGFNHIFWTIDIKRAPGGVVKDGYATVTLSKKYSSQEHTEEPFEIQVSYAHNIASVRRGVAVNGKELNLRKSIWTRHYLLKKRYDFTGL